MKIKIITVVGARPNFMKVAPILRAIREHNARGLRPAIDHVLLHTGQHYDPIMSDRFFEDLELPQPDIHLGVGAGGNSNQTAEILQLFEGVLLREWPDLVMVVGDVNSTIACALATAKVAVGQGKIRPLIAHVESGLRSFDREMPEEINRIVTDHLADLLFVTEKSGLVNLRREGIPAAKVFFTGNTMIDSLYAFKDRADQSTILDQLSLGNGAVAKTKTGITPFALLTLHRPSNVDGQSAFRNILEGISDLSRKMPVIFPVHPRTRKRIEEFGLDHFFATNTRAGGIRLIEPLGYLDFLCLMKNAALVLTDSGGVQEETTCLEVPCVTIRENTERPATVKNGTNLIAGTSVSGIRKTIARQLRRSRKGRAPEKWDGRAAARIIQVLAKRIPSRIGKAGASGKGKSVRKQ